MGAIVRDSHKRNQNNNLLTIHFSPIMITTFQGRFSKVTKYCTGIPIYMYLTIKQTQYIVFFNSHEKNSKHD